MIRLMLNIVMHHHHHYVTTPYKSLCIKLLSLLTGSGLDEFIHAYYTLWNSGIMIIHSIICVQPPLYCGSTKCSIGGGGGGEDGA